MGSLQKARKTLRRKYKAFAEEHCYPLFAKLPLRKNKVFFESFASRTYSDNPKALYEELLRRPGNWKFVWALGEVKSADLGRRTKAVKLRSGSYWYHLATSKYVVSNINQVRAIKRPGQVFVQTMHGTPLKKMGLSVTKNKDKYARLERLFTSDWDYFVSPSVFFSEIIRGPSFGFRGTLLEVGYPRNDFLVNNKNNEELAAQVRKTLGVPEGKKVMLYAPTWRDKQSFQLKIDLDEMQKRFGDEYALVLRAHYHEARFIKRNTYNDFVLNGHGYKDVNEMLIATDVLITDYSSIMFDYAILGRPMVLFTWDYDRYVGKKRGTYFDLKSEYPELVACRQDELFDRLENLDALLPAIESFQKRFNQFETGHAAKDVIDAVFGKAASEPSGTIQ